MAAAVAGVTLIVLMAVLAAAVIQRANQRHEVALREQNARFDVALSNMPVGLSMFDAEHRLIVCNRIYRELYDLPHELTQPGTPFAEIMRYYVVKETGGDLESLEDMHDWLAQYIAKVGQGKQFTDAHRLHDGRTVLVTIGPMANGGWVDVQEDITERRQNEARIEYLARHDHLTGLANRVLLRECLGEALKHRAERGDVALHCLDLDRFKEINDTLGHPAGDAILKLVTERIRGCVRDNDTIARLGGDEFVVLQVAKDPVQVAPPLASRLIEAISEPYEVGGHEVHVGASVGIAVSPIDSTDPDTLLKHADMALYRAKSEGRGRWSLFEQEMNTRQHARFLLARDLRSALANGELEIHYQPILNLSSGEVSCCEALIRWRHPERGLVSPAEFVPVAEETGLIVPISEWVLRQACAEAARWPERVRVAVNISPFYWKSRALSQMVFSAVAASRIAPSRLELEITESALLNTNEATRALLNQLHNVGVRIAMDDFGTGYSSLSYLRNLPFQKIKIDRCFVKDLSDSGKNAIAIIRAISALGRALDLTVTAEGVETQEQLEAIRAEGCTEMQGYLFSPPLPAAELSKYYRRRGDKTATASAKARVQRKPLRRASAARPRRRGGAP
jgi:diguanylate cyclase (GGDEF)-like protein